MRTTKQELDVDAFDRYARLYRAYVDEVHSDRTPQSGKIVNDLSNLLDVAEPRLLVRGREVQVNMTAEADAKYDDRVFVEVDPVVLQSGAMLLEDMRELVAKADAMGIPSRMDFSEVRRLAEEREKRTERRETELLEGATPPADRIPNRNASRN